MKLAWGKSVNAEFRGRVVEICAELRIPDPSWLMACMHFETGGTFSPSIVNKSSGATGLIQFMPSTARGMGTTVQALATKTAVEQLDDVLAYFRPFAGRIKTLADCYMAILYQTAVGKPDDAVLFASGSEAYRLNAALDLDPDGPGPLTKDGAVTKAEAAQFVQRRLDAGLLEENAADSETQPAAPIEEGSHQQEEAMPGIVDAVADAAPVVGTALGGPLGGLIGGLAGAIVRAFAPAAQSKVDKELARHTDPDTAAAVGAALSNSVVEITKQISGKADPIQATAAVLADPALIAQVAAKTVATLEQTAPVYDQLAKIQQAEAELAIAGKDASSKRTIADKLAGLWDMTPTLVKNDEGLAWFLIVAGMLGAIFLAAAGKDTVATALFTGVTTWAGLIFKGRGQARDYRFDGTPNTNASAQLAAELTARRPRA